MSKRSWVRNLFASRAPRTTRRVPARCRPTVEALEDRTVLSPVPLTNHEQLYLELLNRARANPTAEAGRLGIDLNEGLPAGTISAAPKQPVAPNAALLTAMRAHTQDMLDRGYFDHITPAGHPTLPAGAGPTERAAAAGYSGGVSENISLAGGTLTTDSVMRLHNLLFVDTGVDGRGHRLNMLNPSPKEIGPGVLSGLWRGSNSVLANHLFGARSGNSFLTGVVYDPSITIADGFYTPGEGLGGVTITAVGPGGTFTETTGAAGGYFLQLAPGTYTVTASGGTLGTPVTRSVTIGSENVKQDFSPAYPVPPAPTGVAASDVTFYDRVQVTWGASAGATSYEVWRNTTNNPATATRIAPSVLATSYGDATAVTGTTYFYWVKAGNASGVSGFSASDTGVRATQLPAPTNVRSGVDTFFDEVRVAWNASAGATSYEVWRSTSPDGSGAVPIAPSVGALFHLDLTAEPNTNYYYAVRARSATGISDYGLNTSGQWARGRRPSSGLPAPTGVAASDGTFGDKVRVTWSPSAGATSYEVWRNTTNSTAAATRVTTPGVATTSFDDFTAVPGTTYFYWVRADSEPDSPSAFSASDTGHRAGGVSAAPTIARSQAAVTVNEGSPATNTGTFDDPQGRGTVTLTASLGTVTKDDAAGTWSWSYTPPDGPAGPTTVTITATDTGGLTAATTFTLTVNNVAPTILASSVQATGPGDSLLYFGAAATDPAGEHDPLTFTWTFTRPDGGTFTLALPGTALGTDDDGRLHVLASDRITPPAPGSYGVVLTVSDGDGGTASTQSVTVIVGGVAAGAAPADLALSAESVAELSAADTTVGTLSTTDADEGDTHTYTLIDDAGGRFRLRGDQIRVADPALLNYEAATSHTIRVRTTDSGGLSFEKDLVLTLTDVNESPAHLDQTLGLALEDAASFNSLGQGDKWLLDGTGTQRYNVLPNGHLYRWDGGAAPGTLLAQLDPLFYTHPALLYQASAVDLFYAADQALDLASEDPSSFNSLGQGERWLQSGTGQWYTLLPDGTLYRWDGGTGLGTQIAQLDPIFYTHPALLVQATASDRAYHADQALDLAGEDAASFNFLGLDDKWLQSGSGQWYVLLPDGSFYRWDGASAPGTLIALLDAAIFADPSLLWDALP